MLVEASAIQVVGSAATLLTQLALARAMGPDVQGQFSLVKAEIDFLVVFLLLGMPQSVFYFVQKGELSRGAVTRLAWQQALFAMVLTVGWTIVRGSAGSSSGAAFATSAFVTLAVGSAVGYSILRGGVLSVRSSRWFATFSAAPAALVLMIVLIALLAQPSATRSAAFTAGAFVLAYFGCALVGLVPFRGEPHESGSGVDGLARLARFGIASWVPTICQSGVVFIALHRVEQVQDTAATGALAAALALAAIAITPLNLASPLLFKEWTLQDSSRRRAEFFGSVGLVLLGTAVFTACVYAFGDVIVGALFGSQYLPFVPLFALVSLIVGPQALTKLWGVFCSASGRPWLSMVVDVLKVVLVVSALFGFAHTVHDAAFAWVVCEYVALGLGAATLWILRRRRARVDA